MIQGEHDPEILADLARGRLREKRNELKEAVQGTLSDHHRFLLGSQLRQIDFLDGQLRELDQEIAQRLGLPGGPDDPDPLEDQSVGKKAPPQEPPEASLAVAPSLELIAPSDKKLTNAQVLDFLDQIPGINLRIGEIVIAEVGRGVDRFASEDQLVSWAGLCPEAKISAGKRLSNKTGKGNRWLRQALVEAASAAARSKKTFLGAYFQRLRKRMGYKKAIVALAHRILVIIYHLLHEQQPYRELGPEHLQDQTAEASKRWALRRLEQLGYQVTLQEAEVA
ncbi:transposase [Dictyobacter arantiisoli]|nr:transposase [Dictyobacter arantiisoli]